MDPSYFKVVSLKTINFSPLLLLLIVSCNKPNNSASVSLKMLSITDDFGSFGSVGSTAGMSYAQGFLYLPDYEAGRVIKLDQTMKPVTQIGQKGQGPGELEGAGHTFVDQHRLFVSSAFSQVIHVYDTSGQFISSTPLPEFPILTRFAAFEEMIFLSTATKEKPITVVNLEGESLFQFGTMEHAETFETKRARNFKHLLLAELENQPTLVAVSLTEPWIELFDIQGTKLAELRIQGNPEMAGLMQECAAFYADQANYGRSKAFFVDCSLSGTRLACILNTQSPPHKVVFFELSPNKITYAHTKHMDGPAALASIAFGDKDELFMFDDQSNQLARFE